MRENGCKFVGFSVIWNAGHEEEDGAEKLALKNTVQTLFFDLLQVRKVISIPEEFYKISDYSTKASADPNDDDYARKRGSWRILNTGMNGVLTLIGRRRRCCSRMI